MLKLRDYQQDAVDAIIRTARQGNHALACLPTGAGKSLIIAELCNKAKGRVLVVTHTRELVQQDAHEIQNLTGKKPGIYCAGLGEKDGTQPVTVASVQSIVRANVDPFRVIIIDEVHRLPKNKQGQYHKLINKSPHSIIVGVTATPYRLDGGLLYEGEDALFDSLCYDCKTRDLIDDGWLSPIVSYRGKSEADLSGVHSRGGEYINSEMSAQFELIATDTCNDIIAKSVGRNAVLVFCAGIRHALLIAQTLITMGEDVAYIDGTMSTTDRDNQLDRFRSGDARMLVNCDVLTTGFNQRNIDCIALLRATKSAGLYVQMVGRGLRKAEGKKGCLLLDYGHNVRRHGPIDDVTISVSTEGKKAQSKTCRSCGAECSLGTRFCPHCGGEFDIQEREITHYSEADDIDPLRALVEVWEVIDTTYHRHKKSNRPDSLRVKYYCGFGRLASEWICPEHDGYPARKASDWFTRRGVYCDTVSEALEKQDEIIQPKKITVQKSGNYWQVIGYEF